MFWCLVRLSTGALRGGLYTNPLEMAIQSAVACSEGWPICIEQLILNIGSFCFVVMLLLLLMFVS